MEERKKVGNGLRILRESRRISQDILAGKIGLSQAQLSRIERGKQGLRWDVAIRLCQALKMKPSNLLKKAGL